MNKLAELDRRTVTDIAVAQYTNLYNEVDEKNLDMTKLELVLRNAFGAGVQWADAVHEKRKTYEDGLEEMRDKALEAFLDCEGYDEFDDALGNYNN